MKKINTLCIVQKGSQILLGMKKRGFGQGRWNGFGGKLLNEESIEEAAARELKEEAGVELEKMEKRGILLFNFKETAETIEVHLFSVSRFKGNPTETEEMKPRWFQVKGVPYNEMWPDDKYWIPLFLKGKKFKASFRFSDYDKIISHSIKEVESL